MEFKNDLEKLELFLMKNEKNKNIENMNKADTKFSVNEAVKKIISFKLENNEFIVTDNKIKKTYNINLKTILFLNSDVKELEFFTPKGNKNKELNLTKEIRKKIKDFQVFYENAKNEVKNKDVKKIFFTKKELDFFNNSLNNFKKDSEDVIIEIYKKNIYIRSTDEIVNDFLIKMPTLNNEDICFGIDRKILSKLVSIFRNGCFFYQKKDLYMVAYDKNFTNMIVIANYIYDKTPLKGKLPLKYEPLKNSNELISFNIEKLLNMLLPLKKDFKKDKAHLQSQIAFYIQKDKVFIGVPVMEHYTSPDRNFKQIKPIFLEIKDRKKGSAFGVTYIEFVAFLKILQKMKYKEVYIGLKEKGDDGDSVIYSIVCFSPDSKFVDIEHSFISFKKD